MSNMKVCLFLAICYISYAIVASIPVEKSRNDSPISAVVIIPYAPYTTDVVKNAKGKTQKVFVPVHMDIVPEINLKEGEIAMGSQKGMALNLAEGAYPVYYMPGNVNGKFQDKRIYLLE